MVLSDGAMQAPLCGTVPCLEYIIFGGVRGVGLGRELGDLLWKLRCGRGMCGSVQDLFCRSSGWWLLES